MTVQKSTKTDMGTAGLKAFFNIAKLWDLSVDEQKALLGLDSKSDSTYHKWKKSPEEAQITKDKLERLSLLLGIYADLNTLLSNTESADKWIKRPNDALIFAGEKPIEKMTNPGTIGDLYQVRNYLFRSLNR